MTGAKMADASTEYQYPLYDHRGAVGRLVDGNGTVTRTCEHDAGGTPLRDTGALRSGHQSNWREGQTEIVAGLVISIPLSRIGGQEADHGEPA